MWEWPLVGFALTSQLTQAVEGPQEDVDVKKDCRITFSQTISSQWNEENCPEFGLHRAATPAFTWPAKQSDATDQ